MTLSAERRAELRSGLAELEDLSAAGDFKAAFEARIRVGSEANRLLPDFLDALDAAERREAELKAEIVRLRRVMVRLRKDLEATTRPLGKRPGEADTTQA